MSRFTGRNLDRIWFYFFVMHIPITLALDLQPLYPPSLLAKTPLPAFMNWYLSFSRDPIMNGAMSSDPQWTWMRCFLTMEGVVQLPCFIIGAFGLFYNDKRVYPVLLAYGASTATTVVPTIVAILKHPVSPPLTTGEIVNLLSSYVPFFLIPFGIALDMGMRLIKMINQSQVRKSV